MWGLRRSLPTCPTGAISFVEREAAAHDEKAVQENMRKKNRMNSPSVGVHAGCPGSRMQRIQHSQESAPSAPMQAESQLRQWPCQIKLVPVGAPYFEGAKLLIAADCSAYAYARMHEDFMRGNISDRQKQIILQEVTVMSKKMKNIAQAEVLTLKEQISYQEGQVVSKTLAQNPAVSITLFSFAKGEEISTHESGGDAFVTCLDGVGKITIDGTEYLLHEGESIVMPAGHPHAVYGQEAFKMLLVVVFNQT